MFLSLFRYLQGYLKICVTGYSPERFLNLCKNKKIDIWKLESEKNAYSMYIRIQGFRKLKPILKKTKTKVTIEGRYGMPFFFHKYRKRKLFFCGVVLCLFLVYVCTLFVWEINLEGNHSITDEVLLEFLESKDVKHGMLKSNIHCEKIAKEIRKQFDDIIWVSASVEGTKLSVHVKENTDTFQTDEKNDEPCDIIANKAGIVKSIITRNGVPQVKIGDEVQAGDVLVLGTIDVLNDAKEVVSHHYVKADADIIIERVVEEEYKIERKYKTKQYTKKKRQLFYLKLGDRTFYFGFEKNKYKHAETRTYEKQLKMGENFYLPVSYGSKSLREYKLITAEYTKEKMEKLLLEHYERVCRELEETSAIILNRQHEMIEDKSGMKIRYTISLLDTVGEERKMIDF